MLVLEQAIARIHTGYAPGLAESPDITTSKEESMSTPMSIPLNREERAPMTVAQGVGTPAGRAFWILRVGFTAAPILAGIDKFFNVLTDWSQYLPSAVNGLVGGHGSTLMMVVGVVEVAAGIGVALKPRIFSYVVAAWLGVIIVNLLLIPGFFDVALRDFGLLLGALALGQLSAEHAKE